ncbi:AAA family ATPase [Bacteroides caecimuris]|uniref:AAA family ATPase n=1 Tax=Bacteroides caecimuris TaxID=1796613 RepID=UPI002675497F|nr:AAA family ATPase [Bacteroides caecimuris]
MIYISKFRSNDLNPSKGKQIEFNKGVVDKFFNFTDSEHTVDFECHSILNTNLKENIHVEFKLSPSRGDYKIYQNNDGSKDLKDFFLETLHLESDKNLDDYFAIKKKTSTQYILYYLPKDIVFSNFFSIASSDQILFIPEKSEELKEELETLMPYQSIYYGAPGTGKSHSVKCETEAWEKKGRVVRTTFHPDSDYSTFVGAYKPTTESVQRYDIYNKPMTRDGVPVMEQVITYEFVEQAFLQAYIDAWRNREEPEFLIIEEINRGNCAQIFGDLFQLLDRGNDGYSEYAIRADKDLQKHLSKAFEDVEIEDYPNVKTGKELLLPGNLYIRATMNTSDQSLFPIDSAFKRRWDWKYVPIAKGNDNGIELNWMIDIDGNLYDWWTFVKTINKHVFDTTNSEDKQLGFFFCEAKNGIISAETFVCKVIFYLWNDVFKDFGFDSSIFADKEDEMNPKLSFDKFYMADGEANGAKIKMFLANLGIMPTEEYSEGNNYESVDSNGKIPKYSINGSSEQFTTPKAVLHIIEDYARQNENISVDEMIQLWNGISERNNFLVDSWQPSPNDNQPFANKRRTKIEWKNGTVWMINGWTEVLFKKFMDNVKQKLNINILRVN